MSVALVDNGLAMVHQLSAAAWFGALVYRTLFVDPTARRFLGGGAEFERFSLDMAHGMRYVVLAALLACGLSGFALFGLHWNSSAEWRSLMIGKVILWAVAAGLFAYISWVYWPRRVFADATEWARMRRQGLFLSLIMIGIAGLGFVLGQIGQSART